MIDRMITAVRRLVACLTLLLPFEASADDGVTRPAAPSTPSVQRAPPNAAACASPSARPSARPCAPAPKLDDRFDSLGLLLPRLPLMPSACRPLRQYRSYTHDKLQRQPCYYV